MIVRSIIRRLIVVHFRMSKRRRRIRIEVVWVVIGVPPVLIIGLPRSGIHLVKVVTRDIVVVTRDIAAVYRDIIMMSR